MNHITVSVGEKRSNFRFLLENTIIEREVHICQYMMI